MRATFEPVKVVCCLWTEAGVASVWYCQKKPARARQGGFVAFGDDKT
ncbi:MAG: hypothetical protein ACI856_002802 [Kiritimatiellia bacterium]|jgi:hypothetical protein